MSVVHWKCPTQPDDKQQGACPGFEWPVPGDVDTTGAVVANKALGNATGSGSDSSSTGASSTASVPSLVPQSSGAGGRVGRTFLQQALMSVAFSSFIAHALWQ